MSALAQKLAKLKRQAGEAVVAQRSPRAGAAVRGVREVDHANQVAQLRRLMGLRPGGYAMQAPSRDRALDGEEIAPGLRRIELRQPSVPPAEILDLSALGMEPLAASRILAFDTETTGLDRKSVV